MSGFNSDSVHTSYGVILLVFLLSMVWSRRTEPYMICDPHDMKSPAFMICAKIPKLLAVVINSHLAIRLSMCMSMDRLISQSLVHLKNCPDQRRYTHHNMGNQ